jgi:deoxyribose-phosphate aldolase
MNEQYLKVIDHTLLRHDATEADIENCCKEAVGFGFYSVIVQPYYIGLARKLLKSSGVLCGTVIGFPFGAETTDVKCFQAERAIENGAQELDMVICMPSFKNKNYADAENDIRRIVKFGVPVKVIIETSLLSEEEIITASKICIDGGAAFVKTSTGYFGGGATAENIKLIKKTVGDKIKIKAAGGIRTIEDLITMLRCGADRIGTSGGVKIAQGLINLKEY